MHSRQNFTLLLKALAFVMITVCFGGELSKPEGEFLEVKYVDRYSRKQSAGKRCELGKLVRAVVVAEPANGGEPASGVPSVQIDDGAASGSGTKKIDQFVIYVPVVVVVFCLVTCTYFVGKNFSQLAKVREMLISLAQTQSPLETPPPTLPPPALPIEEEKLEVNGTEIVFFVGEEERFNLDDLFEATADLRTQTFCTSLYKVTLKNNAVYAVRRWKKLQVSFEEFSQTMRRIGNMKQPNILPLIGYNCTNEEKLVIYKYQSNGSLLDLFKNYSEGNRDFPWKLRLSIARGIARGIDYIYQNSDNQDVIPHGNLKLSNILLDENEEPLISEYGFSRFLDPKKSCLYSSNGYTAPEKTLSEEGDVFSFGIILLELLTGKTVEKSGIDLPKWVKAMVREEWTGEVLAKDICKEAREHAFPLLNIALKCVSNSAEDRPTMSEVVEKIEEVMNLHDNDVSVSSVLSSPQDCRLLHTIIPETWDTSGSNH